MHARGVIARKRPVPCRIVPACADIVLSCVLPEVAIGGSLEALRKLEAKLGIDLTSGGLEPTERTPSRL